MVSKIAFYSLDISSHHNNIVHTSLNIQLLQASSAQPTSGLVDQRHNMVLDILKCENVSAKGISLHNQLAIFQLQPFHAIFKNIFFNNTSQSRDFSKKSSLVPLQIAPLLLKEKGGPSAPSLHRAVCPDADVPNLSPKFQETAHQRNCSHCRFSGGCLGSSRACCLIWLLCFLSPLSFPVPTHMSLWGKTEAPQ